MKPGGWLLLEHGYSQGASVRALLTDGGFADVSSQRDLAGHERVSAGYWAPDTPRAPDGSGALLTRARA
jgi:release factor glutamine methyltransferase